MKPRVIWLYGLSGAGKSTLAAALAAELDQRGIPHLLLDGDALRAGLSADLDFTPAGRCENIRRAAELARLACAQGITVIAALITPTRELRALARQIVQPLPFTEVFLDCDYATAARRDVKGLYAQAAAGHLLHFTGHSAPFEPPEHPDLRLDTATQSLEECLRRMIDTIDHGPVSCRQVP